MTERDSDRLPQPGSVQSSEPPRTGDEAIDEALLRLADLSEASLSEQHDRLTAVHETLQAALDRPGDAGPTSPS
jgi:hypothetical protein